MSYPGIGVSPTALQQQMVSPYAPVTNISAQLANALLAKQLRDRLNPTQMASQAMGGQISNNGGFLSNLFSLGGGAAGK